MLDVRPAPDLASTRRDPDNRVRVIVTLEDPPLAAAASARQLSGFGPRVKLDVTSSFSRSYIDTLRAEQARAIASIREEIPEAIVSRRYQVLVNGFAVSVPYARLPDLLEVEAADRVYPSYTYRLNLNRGPAVLGAPAFAAATGARGNGVKVAVVDDGVDHEHPFLDPAGFSYPAGFPKGATGSTTPKVIAARGFAGPGANSTPLDRDASFHGTHVAGVIAGVKTDVEAGRQGICVEAQGGCHPAVDGLEGVGAARAHRELPRVQRPGPGAARRLLLGEQPGDRRGVRGGGARRDGHHQLLRRRPAGRSAYGRPHRGGREHRPRRSRSRDLGRQRPRLLRPRNGRISGDSPRCHQRRRRGQRARVRACDDRRRARRSRDDRVPARRTASRRRGSRRTSGSSTSGRSAAPAASSATARCPQARSATRSPSSFVAGARSTRSPRALEQLGRSG